MFAINFDKATITEVYEILQILVLQSGVLYLNLTSILASKQIIFNF